MDAGTLSAFGAFMNLGYRMGFLPYHFSAHPRARKVESEAELENVGGREAKIWMFNDSRRRRHVLYFFLTMKGFYDIFLVIRTVQAFQDKETPMAKKLQVFYLTVIFFISNLFNFLTISFYGEHGKYLNAVLDLGYQLKGNIL